MKFLKQGLSLALLGAGLAAVPGPQATALGQSPAQDGGRETTGVSAQRTPGYVDRRQLSQKATVRADRDRLRTQSSKDARYQQTLGTQALIDIDALTGTPRNFAKLSGYLTGPSSAPARTVALTFVRQHLSTLGLSSADLSTFTLARDYVDAFGVHNLSWTQSVNGTQVFGNGLKVKVTRAGRVLAVQGSPVSGLADLAAKAPGNTEMSAAAARSRAARDVGGKASDARPSRSTSGAAAATTWANNDYARKVWFLTPAGLRPGWSTYVQSGGGEAYQHVVDAASGALLFRRSTVNEAEGDAYVYDNYPGAAQGGEPRVVNFRKRGWLTKNAQFLKGDSVVAWSDVNDDNRISENEKTPVPGTKKRAQFKLTHVKTSASDFCSRSYVCTWDPNTPFSWRKNRKADVTQAFYLASNFHDYLENGPARFTPAAGNFTAADGDPLLLNALDGARVDGGLPDGNHIDNANMSTPPDGTPPTMQMYLWHYPGATDAEDPFTPTSSAFDASVEYHEYTHGLSNRLVVDADSNSTLNSIQAGSMGEGWSDFYAMDYLVKKGFVNDGDNSGQVFEGKYLMAGKQPFRTMAIDCAVAAKVKGCTALDGTRGGYTYGEFPSITGSAEVHSSGEVWGQTLWDIRKEFGSTPAVKLITRAMSLSAADPSFLDMRNAIVQADLVGFDGSHTKKLWKIFAARGMGYFAGAINGDDAAPAEDFHVQPAPDADRTSISGTVTDPTTGDPVEGAVVSVAGQGDQFSDVTNAGGEYSIDDLYAGTYQKIYATAPGYFGEAKQVDSRADSPTDFSITRDFAAASGGAEIIDFNGADYTAYGCGPGGAIDMSQSTGWGSTTGDNDGTPTSVFVPKHITIDLPTTVDISSFGVDPTATCGDDDTASTGDYTIETSPDGIVWTTAAQGTFTPADQGQINQVDPTGGAMGVRYVRFTMLGNQTPDFATNCPDGPYSGCSFTDLTELAVFGSKVP